MAGRKSKLEDDVIAQICKYVKLRMKMKEIAEIIDVVPQTIYKWIREGREAKSGKKRELVDAIEKAKSELTADLSQIVFNAAFVGSETVTVKEVKLPDGEIRKETTIKRMPPDAAEARRILALMHPDRWAEVKHIKYEWKESVEKLGLDPKKIEEMFFKHLEESQEKGSESPIIPELPGRTV